MKDEERLKGIGEILDEMQRSTSLGRHLEEARVWARWPEVVGSDLMPFGRPVGLREGTFVIEVAGPVWMHKYSYRKQAIIQRINEMMGEDRVEDIFFTLVSEEDSSPPQDGV